MNFHQQLRTQFKRFNISQQTLTQRLQLELRELETYLRESLGLNACYKKSVTDEQACEPYLHLGEQTLLSANTDLPSVRFSLIVVLDEDESVYPKLEISQLFDLAYIQPDRMVLRFLPPIGANFPFNLGDTAECKFNAFAKAFQQCLLRKLER